MSNKSLFGSALHFANMGNWKAGSHTSNPLLLKAQSQQLFIGLQQSHSTTESTITALQQIFNTTTPWPNPLHISIRAVKFTKNKNDQWNHAGGFSISICAGLSLKMQPRNNWLNCRARCMGSEPPKCRRLHASGILRVRIWKG